MDLICFIIGSHRYGMQVSEVQEIQPLSDYTPIPWTPGFIMGAMNLRGNILTLVDLLQFFGIVPEGLQDLRKVIVLHSAHYLVGLVVRDVFDLVRVPRSSIIPPLTSEGGIDARYVRGLLPDLTILIKAAAILEDPRLILDDEAGTGLAPRTEET